MIDLEVKDVRYFPKDTVLEFKSHYDYSNISNNMIPFHLRNIIPKRDELLIDYNARQFINAAGSYDKPVSGSYEY
jgi:hypothetical protein